MEKNEMKAVLAVLEAYREGTFKADMDLLKSAFHKEARMAGFLKGEPLVGTPEPFFEDIAAHPSMSESKAPYHLEVKAALVTGRIASLVVLETGFFGDGVIETHFHLIKDQDWKIISKVFTSLPG